MTLSARSPSTAWEPLPDASGSLLAWAWWKPSGANDLIVSVPPERLAAGPVSARTLVDAASLTWAEVSGWVVAGQFFDAAGGQNPLLDQPLPPGFDGQIVIRGFGPAPMLPAGAIAPQSMPATNDADGPSAIGTGACEVDANAAERLLAGIDADWQATIKLERDLRAKMKEAQAAQGRLSALTRDLSADERRFADSNDLREWNDAKRFLRDAAAKLSKQARDYELGTVSAAGARNRFEEVHRKYVVSKTPFAGITQVAKEFEQHRKTAQNLLQSLSSATSSASTTAESKAKRILANINAKARKARAKR